jgi:hypothetical protein
MPRIFLMLLVCLQALPSLAASKPHPGPFFENDDMKIALTPRTPEQMAAFYEARGFPPEALERIQQTCFFTVIIKNNSKRILWLELDQWTITSDGKVLPHLDEHYWNAQWDEINLRQASRSTFGWTQLPLVRDLQPGEGVGGNMVIPGATRVFNIEARFHTGADKQGEVVRLGFGNVNCQQETSVP